MADITLKAWAKTIGQPVGLLIKQMEKAGFPSKSADDMVSQDERARLIQSLQKNESVARRGKTAYQAKVQSKSAGANVVSVEVRGKKVAAKKSEEEAGKKTVTATTFETPPSIAPKKEVKPPPARPPAPSPAAVAQPVAPKPASTEGKGDSKSSERRELRVSKDKRGKRKVKKKRVRLERVVQPKKQEFEKPTVPVKREIEIPENISVGDLAQRIAIKSGELIKQMIGMGMMATINQTLEQDTAVLIVEELGHTTKLVRVSDANVEESLLADERKTDGEMVARPPVVTVMGHVDHGKTSLLDRIRKAQVASGEAGGITQHIGAYHVNTPRGTVTFLDTPGHAAFTSMRARGANATDIVVLVVAADDGIMPQTEEAIEHSRAAKVPIVVAINKIDKTGADPEKIRGDLAQKEIVSEEWGGQNIFVNVSAKTGEGIDALLEAILLQAEVMELKAMAGGAASGIVIESSLDKGRGPMATVLVKQGSLRKGDNVLAGQEFGRARALLDENGEPVISAGPSIPVVILGLSGAPVAGEEMHVISSERKAREIADFRSKKVRERKFASQNRATTAESIFERLEEKQPKKLSILIKADVQGSAEALKDSLSALSGEEIQNKIVSSGIGGINESDVDLAAAADAVIIGFNVRAGTQVRKMALTKGVQIRYYSVIYEAIDDVRQIMSGMLEPEIREKIVGVAEVKDVFRSSKMGAVAGCQVVEGVIKRGNSIRVLRDDIVIFEGGLESLRRHKDDVAEVVSGTECGIAVKNYDDVRAGDNIEVYEQVKVQRKL